jgi:UDP-N-acetylmuramoylalanine--D-glutamate ligase
LSTPADRVSPLLAPLYRGPTLVVGLARSGRAAALALARRGAPVVATDVRDDADVSALHAAGIEVRLGIDDERALDGPDAAVATVVKSPGVPAESGIVRGAHRRGVPVWSEVELGWRLLAEHPFVGVTGTNGKTTTVELLGEMFRAAGRAVAVAGNVGRPLSGLDGELVDGTWIVCELSSFQLEDVDALSCHVAVLLNLEPDHLDRHGSFEAYRDAKLRIFERAAVKVVPRGMGLDGLEFSAGDELPAEPLIRGAHNRENAAAATAAARAAGVGDESIAAALRSFPGVPHRLELVGEVGSVRFVNDSKATNVAAARRALAAYADEPVHLILGGSLKGEDFAPLAASIGANVRTIHLIGEAAETVAAALGDRAHDRDETLARALEHAYDVAGAGDVVLLSPACASYDQYANFEQRGDEFRRLVSSLST